MHRRRSDPEQRRRLLLLEEATRQEPAAQLDSQAAAPAEAPRRSLLYPPEAQRDGMVRLADLIPRRGWVLALWWLAGVGVIALLEWLYAWMPRLAHLTTDGRVAALDLDGEGSLAVWYSSTLLLLAAGLSWFIYTVRRHRLDDYRARYRFWLLGCGVWLLMSIDETGSLHEGFKEMMSHLTGTRIAGDGSLWWVAAYLVVLVPLGGFLLRELSASPAALTALGMTALSYLVAVLAQLQWLWPQSGARGVMLEEGAEMTGHLFLVLALVLYARTLLRQLQLPGELVQEKTSLSAQQQPDSQHPAKPAERRPGLNERPKARPSPAEEQALAASPRPEPAAGAEAEPSPAGSSAPANEAEPAAAASSPSDEQLQLLGQKVATVPSKRKKKKRKKKKRS